MTYDKHRSAVEADGGIWWSASATRGRISADTLHLTRVDWSDENLTAKLALRPGLPAFGEAIVEITDTQTKTWAAGLTDLGVDAELQQDILPKGVTLEDETVFSNLVLTFPRDAFNSLALNTDAPGEPQNIYIEIVRKDGTGIPFVYADAPVKETVL